MKISIQWLKKFLILPESPSEIATLLSKSGLEVVQIDTYYPLQKEKLAGLIIGQIEECIPHPNAHKLHCTRVNIGKEQSLSIICGAPNVAVGQKVAVAPVGTKLYPYQGESFTIRMAKIRGLISEGMLCAEDEIGISSKHETILSLETDLPPGNPLVDYFDVALDHVLTIDLTPNRIEAASHLGIARTLRALLNRDLYSLLPAQPFMQTGIEQPLEIQIHELQDCPRYAGMLIKNIQIKPSPSWMQDRLKAIGVSPINNLVDITNWVMYELGQPLHAFDYHKLQGSMIQVRRAQKGEQITTLDGITRILTGEELMIADAKESIAIAGILGGEATAINLQTNSIFLESAYFLPSRIRLATKQCQLQTEAAYRYERGTDPDMPALALQRAFQLLQEIAEGELCMSVDHYPLPIVPLSIPISYEKIQKMIGVTIPSLTIRDILCRLDIEILDPTPTNFTAVVPPYRNNIRYDADIVEEIARVYGYDNITEPAKWKVNFLNELPIPFRQKVAQSFSTILVSNGYQEICTNTLTMPYGNYAEKETEENIALLNPLSDRMTILRKQLVFAGVEVIGYNINRKKNDLKLFEFAKTYCYQNGQYLESNKLGIWLTGYIESINWIRKSRFVTFQDLNTILNRLISRWCPTIHYSPFQNAQYKFALQAAGTTNQSFMSIGEVAPAVGGLFNVKQAVFFAEIDLDILTAMPLKPLVYEPVSKFPAVKRDLSLVVDLTVTYQDIKSVVAAHQEDLLKEMHVFDVYQGSPLPIGKKAYAISFTLQEVDRTLDEITIRKAMEQLIGIFQEKLGALIRE